MVRVVLPWILLLRMIEYLLRTLLLRLTSVLLLRIASLRRVQTPTVHNRDVRIGTRSVMLWLFYSIVLLTRTLLLGCIFLIPLLALVVRLMIMEFGCTVLITLSAIRSGVRWFGTVVAATIVLVLVMHGVSNLCR